MRDNRTALVMRGKVGFVPRRSSILIFGMLLLLMGAGPFVAGAASGGVGGLTVARFQTAAYCPTPEELDLLELINAHREVNGRQPLALSNALGAAARHHAQSMADFDYFDYTLVPEGIDFAQNIANAGYTGAYLGANIAAGPSSDQAAIVFSQWLASPSQRDNLLNPGFLAIGLGSASNPDSSFTNYWAATFGELAADPVDPECDSAGASAETGESLTITAPATPTSLPAEESVTAETLATETVTEIATAETTSEATEIVSSPTATAIQSATETPAAAVSPVPTEAGNGTPAIEVTAPIGSPSAFGSPAAEYLCTTDRAEANASQSVVVTCAGFTPGEQLSLFWDQPREANLLDSIEADSEGNGELSFLPPETPAGRYTVVVRGSESQRTATAPFDVQPGLFVLPKSGDPGDVVTADLTGYQPGEAVTLNWYVDESETRVLRVVTVGEDGSLTTTFRAPASDSGEHDISAVGISGTKASATFEIESS